MRAGFAEADITPPIGTLKIGWLMKIVSDRVNDNLFAHIAIFESNGTAVAFIQLDTLSVRWTFTNEVRSRISKKYGFPGEAIMVCATHNHAGPATSNTGEVERDEIYIESLTEKIVDAFGAALDSMQSAEIGFASVLEWEASRNRRAIMRDGTVCTHLDPGNTNFLRIEGPIDPEVAVVAARAKDGKLIGCMVNFGAHPTHFGGDGTLSAGYPGVLARLMKDNGCPVTLFLNGPCGNIQTPFSNDTSMGMDETGRLLAEDVKTALGKITYKEDAALAYESETVTLPYRTVTEDEIKGTVRGAQRFIDPAIYDRGMDALVERIKTRKTQPAEVQVLYMGEYAFVGIPAEYFVEHGLRIKEESYPIHALVVAQANGMVGYLPTAEAFKRGGYETTFAGSSRMAPEAGRMLADCAIRQINNNKE